MQETGLDSEELRKQYMMERFMARVAVSKYSDQFILKGGYLIESLIGVNNRMTQDLDASFTNLMTEAEISDMVHNVAEIDLNDGIQFNNLDVKSTSEGRYNPGYEIHIEGDVPNRNPQRKVHHIKATMDFSVNDSIIPVTGNRGYTSMFDGENIDVRVLPIEQTMAEKVAAIIDKSNKSTRTHDFYDLYMLDKFKGNEIDNKVLRQSIDNQLTRHGLSEFKDDPISKIYDIADSPTIQRQWKIDNQKFKHSKFSDLKLETATETINTRLRSAGYAQNVNKPLDINRFKGKERPSR